MRIAFVSNPWCTLPEDARFGGEQAWTYQVARRLASRGEVIVYSREQHARVPRRRSHIEDGILFRRIAAPALTTAVGRLAGKRFSARKPLFASSVFQLPYALSVAADLRRRRCDIVHIHDMSQFVPLVRAFNPSAKIVLHMQLEWLTQLDHQMIARRLRHVDLVIGCSEHITGQIRREFGQVAASCRTVYNGVDLDLFTPAERDPSVTVPPRAHLMYAGRVSPEKGVHLLLEAFRGVAPCYPEAVLEIVGAIAAAGREYVVALSDVARIQALELLYGSSYESHLRTRLTPDIADRVTLTGRMLPHPSLAARLRTADLFVHPAIWDEPFGMNVVEAMATGLPVVATRAGGPAETVDDGITGLLVPPDDASALARAIAHLMAHAELREAMGRAARRRAAALFSWDRVAAAVSELYDELHAGSLSRQAKA